jgi:lysozyme
VIKIDISEELLDSIKQNEGYSLTVYKDSLGFDTIGYGFAIKDLALDKKICEDILVQKLVKLIKRCHNRFQWLDAQPQEIKEIIYEMCYQLGVTGVSKFKKTLKYIEQNDYEEASIEMLDSRWAVQTPARANLLSEKMKSVV